MLEVISTFVDFKKAFDYVDHNMMFEIVSFYGTMVSKSIMVLNADTEASVLTPGGGGETISIQILAGILQGYTHVFSFLILS